MQGFGPQKELRRVYLPLSTDSESEKRSARQMDANDPEGMPIYASKLQLMSLRYPGVFVA